MKITYSIKNWATALIISPLFLVLYDAVADTEFVFDDLGVYFVFILMGAIFSLPGLFVYFFVYKALISIGFSNIIIRLTLILVASLMALIALWLIKGSIMIPMMLSYVSGVLISGFIYPLKEE
uniref:hypothetical protein n=1 Tax=Roseivirga sp. TaxID=1964215 RepID=UPI00404728BD